jgi:hypothetical protein
MTTADLHLVLEKEQEAVVCSVGGSVSHHSRDTDGVVVCTGQPSDSGAFSPPPTNSLGRIHSFLDLNRAQ